MIKITFPDGSVREYEAGVTGLQIAESISSRLAQDVLACGVNGEIVELNRPINEDASVVLYKWEDAEGKHAFWHTSAHLMAEAMQELYPGMQFGIGPAIENGFYYDVMPPAGTVIRESDFAGIEKKMLELAQRKEPVVRAEISKADALKFFGERGQTYKNELIEDLEDGHISTYTQGAFTDLCRGPHLMNTGVIKAVKVTAVSSAYWRGDEKRPQMTRVYAISFPKKKMLDEYLALMEEAKKRDHRKIGHAQHRGVDTHAVPHHLRVRCRRTAKCHGRKRGPAVLFDEDCRIERQHVGHRQGDVLVQDEGVQLCFLYADLFHRTNSCNTDLTNGHHQRGVVVPPAVAGRFFLCSDCCGEAQTDKQKYWFLHIAYRFNTNKKPPE